MEPRDPVKHSDAARLEIARLVVFGLKERRYIRFLRPRKCPLCPHVGSIDADPGPGAVFWRRTLRRDGNRRDAHRREGLSAQCGSRRDPRYSWIHGASLHGFGSIMAITDPSFEKGRLVGLGR